MKPKRGKLYRHLSESSRNLYDVDDFRKGKVCGEIQAGDLVIFLESRAEEWSLSAQKIRAHHVKVIYQDVVGWFFYFQEISELEVLPLEEFGDETREG